MCAHSALSPTPKKLLLLGATGTIGRATARALVARGHDVVCLRAAAAGVGGTMDAEDAAKRAGRRRTSASATATDPASLAPRRLSRRALRRPGLLPRLAHRRAQGRLGDRSSRRIACAGRGARQPGVAHFVLLSAICVQKPLLAFQQAKLAFERADRLGPDLFDRAADRVFKSLSRPGRAREAGQAVPGVRRRHAHRLQADQRRRSRPPISPTAWTTPRRCNRMLPIGGPGPAITPREQGEQLFALLGRPPRFQQRAGRLLDAIIGGCDARAVVRRAARQGRTGAHRPLLRDRIDAGPRSGDRPLRRRRDALDRDARRCSTSTRADRGEASSIAATTRCSDVRGAVPPPASPGDPKIDSASPTVTFLSWA